MWEGEQRKHHIQRRKNEVLKIIEVSFKLKYPAGTAAAVKLLIIAPNHSAQSREPGPPDSSLVLPGSSTSREQGKERGTKTKMRIFMYAHLHVAFGFFKHLYHLISSNILKSNRI